jgi:arsenite-transporting ATPase
MNAADSSLIPHPSSLLRAFDQLERYRVLLFGGKGGVGKTTISVAAALHYAQSRNVVLFTTDPASNLGDLLEQAHNLTIESIDADALYKKFLDENLASFLELGDRGTYLEKDELRRIFELSVPGIDELMAWMRIGELAEENPDAIVVVDTAPTGHTMRMVAASHHFAQLANALDTMQAKHRDLVQQFTRRRLHDALDDFLADFTAKADRRRALLNDASVAAFVPVFLAEPWVVEQTKRLIEDVSREGIAVPFAILNRVDPCGHSLPATLPVPVIPVRRFCSPFDPLQILSEAKDPPPEAASSAGDPSPSSRLRIKRLTFLAGKGGVGKTTCSASIALQLAQKSPEKKFVVISVDPAHSLRDVFANEKPPANLSVEAIDTRARWRHFRDTLGDEIERAVASLTPKGVSVAYDTDALRQLIEIAPPGADELFAIDRISDLVADQSIAGIVVDTAPTGHFLRLIDLPKTAGEWVREFMRLLLRYRDLVPAGTLGEELLRASRALHSLEKAMRSDDCEVIVVTRPERIVIAETKRLIASVEERGIRIGGVIANYLTPESDCACDQSMRSHESRILRDLGRDVVAIERQDAPVTSLAALATLVEID